MKYDETISLKDGRTLRLRNGFEQDARAALEIFILGHEQTDYLLSYPDENDMTVDEEAQFLAKKAASADEIELLAYIGDRIVGLAGIEKIGDTVVINPGSLGEAETYAWLEVEKDGEAWKVTKAEIQRL